MFSLLLFCNGAEKSSRPGRQNACQGRERSASVLPPCFAPPSRACASAGTIAYPSVPVTADQTAAALPESAGSVRCSKAIFRSALRVPLSPSGTRYTVPCCVLSFSSHFIVLTLLSYNKCGALSIFCARFTVPARHRVPARCPGSRREAARAAE